MRELYFQSQTVTLFFLRMLSEFAVLYFKVAFTGVIFFSRDLAVIVVSRSYMDLDVFVHS